MHYTRVDFRKPSARRPRLVLRFRVCVSFSDRVRAGPQRKCRAAKPSGRGGPALKSGCFCRSFPMQCHRMFCDWGDFEASEELRHRRRACKAVLLALPPSPPESPLWELCSRFPPLRCTSAAGPCASQYRAVKASFLRAKSATGPNHHALSLRILVPVERAVSRLRNASPPSGETLHISQLLDAN